MAFLAHYGIWILIGTVAFTILIGVPFYFLYKAYKIRQYGGGDYIIFWKLTPNGTHIMPKIKRYDRGKIVDTKTVDGPDGKVQQVRMIYEAPEGRTPMTMFPFLSSKFFQVSIAMAIAVDGQVNCLDLLTEYKIRAKLPTADPRHDAQRVQQMVAQKSGETLMGELRPDNKGAFKLQGWMVIGLVIIAMLVVIIFGVMLMKINGGIGDLKSLFTINPNLPGG